MRPCLSCGLLFLVTAFGLPPTRSNNLIPIYSPASKSYIQMMDSATAREAGLCNPDSHEVDSCPWRDADAMARALSYKGARGRLVVIKNKETQEFLETHFYFGYQQNTWIGLRYWCNSGKFQWVDGEYLGPHDFVIWNRQWDESEGNMANGGCSSYNIYGYLGFAMHTPPEGGGWFAKEAHKYYSNFFVEYPTGRP